MIRKYKTTDLNSVMDIWYKASTLAHPFLEDDFVSMVKNAMKEVYIPKAADFTWLFEENNEVLAFISMTNNEIGGLFVMPGHHSKGIGAHLVNHIKSMHKTIEVEVFKNNKIGRRFYDKYGFKLMHEYYHEQSKQDVLRMSYN